MCVCVYVSREIEITPKTDIEGCTGNFQNSKIFETAKVVLKIKKKLCVTFNFYHTYTKTYIHIILFYK